MLKNVASQKVTLFAFDSTTGAAKTGDAANISAYVSKDYGSVSQLADTSATELDSTNAKGWYLFDVTQSETNADYLLFTGKSSTSNIVIVSKEFCTAPPYFTTQVIDSNGRIDVSKLLGAATALTNLCNAYAGMETGTAQAGAASTITLRSGASASDNFYKDQVIFILSGTGAGQTNRISSYVGSTKVATVETAWVTQPDNTSVYLALGRIG